MPRDAAENRLERALLILEHVTASASPPTHADLRRALGIHRSTLSDLLADLRHAGYLSSADRRWVPGPRLIAFVYEATRHAQLHAAIRPTLEHLAAATKETAVYVIEFGSTGTSPGHVVAVDQVESPRPLRLTAPLGQPFPHDRSAAGLAFLAFGHSAMLRAEARAEADARVAAPELCAIRNRAYALNVPTAATRSIAAPVRDVRGAVVGVLAILGPPGRYDKPERDWPLLRDAIAALEERTAAPEEPDAAVQRPIGVAGA